MVSLQCAGGGKGGRGLRGSQPQWQKMLLPKLGILSLSELDSAVSESDFR